MYHTTVHPITPDDSRKHCSASYPHDLQYQIPLILPYEADSYNKGEPHNPSHHRNACLLIDGKYLPEYQYPRFPAPENTACVPNRSGNQAANPENEAKKDCCPHPDNLFQGRLPILFYQHTFL